MIKNNNWFISLETILFIWYTWYVGYGTAVYPSMFWLIGGTIINILCWNMLFRNLYVPWNNKIHDFIVSLILFCWYCWRIPNDGGSTILITLIYEFVDVGTWFIAGVNLIMILRGISFKNKTALI